MRIYVACLASYNNGVLHGRWIDAVDDVDAMRAEVNAMLRESRFPNVVRQEYHCDDCGETETVTLPHDATIACAVCPHCNKKARLGEKYATAEEFAIHDHEGLGELGEYAGLDEVARRVGIAEVAEEHGIPLAVLLEALRDNGNAEADADEVEDFISDKYRGTYESWRDMAEEFTRDVQDMSAVPDWLQNHIDWDSIARDFELSGDWSAYDHEGDMYFFWSH